MDRECYDSLEEMPKTCKICGASDFRPTRQAQHGRTLYIIFVCQYCKHQVWVKKREVI